MSDESNRPDQNAASTPPPASASPPAPALVPDPAMSGGMNANTWAMMCHLSALLGFLFPFGNFIGPLVCWLVKKDTMPEVDRHGKEALNFQISLTIYVMVATAISVILFLIVIGIFTLILTGIAWMIMGILFPILAALKANEGAPYYYPMTIRFIK